MDRVNLDWMIPDTPHFIAVLTNGERVECQLLQCGQKEIFVETAQGKLLIPERSIQYYMLDINQAEGEGEE